MCRLNSSSFLGQRPSIQYHHADWQDENLITAEQMPYLLRRRLVCFYCGYKSSQYKTPGLTQWQCEQCDAVNHLDANGEITDPPVAESDTPQKIQQYATEATKYTSPDLTAPSNRIFCGECQKNQHIFVETLATYLPDPSDPKYSEYERNLPAYRRQLEERYPQVCSKCVHLVNNRIESMTYLARTENLKLALAKTRRGLVPLQNRLGFKGCIIWVGGCMWWVAVLGQLVWHLMGLTLSTHDDAITSLPMCLLWSAYKRKSDLRCYATMTDAMPTLIAVGWLSIWWNNKIYMTANGFGRLQNLNDYYFSQFIFLLLRSAAFWIVTSQRHFFAIPTERIHGALVVFMIIFVFSSLSIVQIRRQPTLADYKLQKIEVPRRATVTLDLAEAETVEDESPLRQAFPLSAMAPSVGESESLLDSVSRRKLSDSTDMSSLPDRDWLHERSEDLSSEMDWTPTQSAFSPRQPVRSKIKEKSYTPQLSPFKQKLPPAPEHPLHTARKPAKQPIFSRTSEQIRNELKDSIGKRSVFDNWGLPVDAQTSQEMSMGAPRLTLTQQETGLENLFNSVFSLQDEPQELQPRAVPAIDKAKGKSGWARTATGILMVSIPISVVAAWLMTRSETERPWSVDRHDFVSG